MGNSILTSIHGRKLGLSADGDLIVNKQDGSILGCSAYKLVTSAQVLALNATPITIIAAPGSGVAIVPKRWAIYKPAGTAYAGIAAGEDLVLKYTNASGAQISTAIETTGFLDQTSAQSRVAGDPGATGSTADGYAPLNAAVVLHLLTGEITTGDSPLHVKVWYDVLPITFTA